MLTTANYVLYLALSIFTVAYISSTRMRTRVHIETFEEMLVYQAEGLGLVLLVLGVGHFFSVNIVLRIARRGLGMYTRAGLK